MTFKEQKEKLFAAVQLLMEVYQDLAARAEPFTLSRNNSEVKKIPQTGY